MSIELTLNDINKAAMCVMGANQGDTQLMERSEEHTSELQSH